MSSELEKKLDKFLGDLDEVVKQAVKEGIPFMPIFMGYCIAIAKSIENIEKVTTEYIYENNPDFQFFLVLGQKPMFDFFMELSNFINENLEIHNNISNVSQKLSKKIEKIVEYIHWENVGKENNE